MTNKLHLLKHPVLQHKLAQLRDKNTSSAEFRKLVKEMAVFVAYEATRDLSMETMTIETPMGSATAEQMTHSPIVVSIMRAGNEMLDGILDILPEAKAGHIGIYRDRFIHNTVEYYLRLPKEIKQNAVLLLDPILATGDTVLACIERLQQFGAEKITILCLLVSNEGVAKVHEAHPNIDIYAVAMESEMTEQGFLVPGIGDVGNRLYGTFNH